MVGSLSERQVAWGWLEEPDVLWVQAGEDRRVRLAAASAAAAHLEWTTDTDFDAIGLNRSALLIAWRAAGDGATGSWREAARVEDLLVLVLHRTEGRGGVSEKVAALLQ